MLLAMAEPRLTVAVVTYRTPDLALDCLRSVVAAAPAAPVRLVDTDPSAEFAARVAAAQPTVAYVPAENRSYSHAVNVGLAGAATEFVALMNADVQLGPATFTDLIQALDRDDGAGAAGPLALGSDGRPQDLGPWYARHYRALRRRADAARSSGAPDGGAAAPASVDVPWLSGCLHVVRSAVWRQLGGYDEAFRFCNEDLDFGLRLGRAGLRSSLVDTRVVHLGGTSTPPHPAFAVEGRRGGLIIGRRHYPAPLFAAQRAFVLLEGLAGGVLAGTPGARAAYRELRRLAASGDLDRSPFGATLDDRPPW